MFSVETPAQLILTLQSVPPFVVESIFALALAILLAIPLVVQIQHLLDGSPKVPKTSYHRFSEIGRIGPSNPTIVMHYPAPPMIVDAISSTSLNLNLTAFRQTCSTPDLKSSADSKDRRLSRQNTLSLDQSSSFFTTNAELPIIDISKFDYNAYRHKLIEAALRRQYDGCHPPGNVVFNSIHLNTTDSSARMWLNDKYSHSFFDFMKEYYDVSVPIGKKETEYLHPLDHFVVKKFEKPSTAEKITETMDTSEDEISDSTNLKNNQSTVSASGQLSRRSRRNVNDVSDLKVSDRTTWPAASKTSKILSRRIPGTKLLASGSSGKTPTTQQLYRSTELSTIESESTLDSCRSVDSNCNKITRSRTPSLRTAPKIGKTMTRPRSLARDEGRLQSNENLDETQLKSSMESLVGEFAQRNDGRTTNRELTNFTSASSSDADSCRLDEGIVNRVRMSRVRSKNCTSAPAQQQPRLWNVGTRVCPSFNRKFNENLQSDGGRACSKLRSMSSGRSASERPDTSSRHSYSNPSSSTGSRNGSPCPRPTTANPTSWSQRRSPEEAKSVLKNADELSGANRSKGVVKKDRVPFSTEDEESSGKAAVVMSSGQLSSSQKGSSQSKNFPTGQRSSGLTNSAQSMQSPILMFSNSSLMTSGEQINPRFRNTSFSGSMKFESTGNHSTTIVEKSSLSSKAQHSGAINAVGASKCGSNRITFDKAKDTSGTVTTNKKFVPKEISSQDTKRPCQSEDREDSSRKSTKDADGSNLKKNTWESKHVGEPLKSATNPHFLDMTKSKTTSDFHGEPKKSTERTRSFRQSQSRYRSKIPRAAKETRAKKSTDKPKKQDSKSGLLIQRSLRSYIKRLKQVLANRDNNMDTESLASLSLKEAIVPDLRSMLDTKEVQELQSLLDRVETSDDQRKESVLRNVL